MRINVTDIDEYMEDSTLDESLYEVEVIDAESMISKSGYEMLLLRMTVTNGPTQMNGKSPIGEEVTLFVVLDPDASQKPRGREMIKERVGNTFASFGVSTDSEDEHDFVGKRAIAKIRPGEDKDGFPISEVRRFKKLAE